MGDATDFIGRIRARVESTEVLRQREAAMRPIATRVTVLVTRDGTTTEELHFNAPPTLADLAARVGAGAYVLGIGLNETPVSLAAE